MIIASIIQQRAVARKLVEMTVLSTVAADMLYVLTDDPFGLLRGSP